MLRFAMLLGSIAIITSAPAGASIVRALDLPALTARADTIVHGRVGRQHSFWERGRIITEQTVAVIGALKGSPGREVLVRRFGGVVDGIGQMIHGSARLRSGEEVVLFLRASAQGFRTVGMAQGKFAIRADARTGARSAVQELGGLALMRTATSTSARIAPRKAKAWKLHDLFSRIAAAVAAPASPTGVEAR